MTSIDEQDAIKALTYRLTEWGVDQAADKAKLYVTDLVNHGWGMNANARPIRRPPMKHEECATHAGEYSDFCRACVADRKAATTDEPPSAGWTPQKARDAIAPTRTWSKPVAPTDEEVRDD